MSKNALIYIAVRPDKRLLTGDKVRDLDQYAIVKKPRNDEATLALIEEYNVIKAIGEHENIISLVECHMESIFDFQKTYFSTKYTKAKCLLSYIKSYLGAHVKGNEAWCRYLFKQYISGLN